MSSSSMLKVRISGGILGEWLCSCGSSSVSDSGGVCGVNMCKARPCSASQNVAPPSIEPVVARRAEGRWPPSPLDVRDVEDELRLKTSCAAGRDGDPALADVGVT